MQKIAKLGRINPEARILTTTLCSSQLSLYKHIESFSTYAAVCLSYGQLQIYFINCLESGEHQLCFYFKMVACVYGSTFMIWILLNFLAKFY